MIDMAQWGATILIALGLIYTIWRNGQRQSSSNSSIKTELKMEIQNIQQRLDDKTVGLAAIKKSVDEQKFYCAETSSSFRERIKSLEKEK